MSLIPVLGDGQGHSQYDIPEDQLQFLIGINFDVPTIARILGVSQSTVRRRMDTYGLSIRGQYSEITDLVLDDIVRSVKQQHPDSGYRMIIGYLNGRGLRIQESRVRSSLSRVDPLGVASRLSRNRSINRRRYCVPHPNAVWHLDGNMKLVRWGFVVHGGIDGYSRVITFLSCSTNNRADTVLQKFLVAGQEFGFPSRVRSDHGGENYDVAQFMLNFRGLGRSSHITGSSTRNQRIERLWRDVFENCLSLYYNLFYFLEDQHVLDVECQIQLFCLHFIYTPRIQKSLDDFRTAWNYHTLTSARCCSPLQLWTLGMIYNQGFAAVDETFLPVSTETSDSDSGSESANSLMTTDDALSHLYAVVDPLEDSEIYGIDLYSCVLDFMDYALTQQ
jgi:hypothetical protein